MLELFSVLFESTKQMYSSVIGNDLLTILWLFAAIINGCYFLHDVTEKNILRDVDNPYHAILYSIMMFVGVTAIPICAIIFSLSRYIYMVYLCIAKLYCPLWEHRRETQDKAKDILDDYTDHIKENSLGVDGLLFVLCSLLPLFIIGFIIEKVFQRELYVKTKQS